MTAKEILKKYWGFDDFRLNQADIIASAINGHDTFALLPTGGGKSICFQVPGIAREGLCLVISPLIALMQDQVKNLKEKGLKAAAITSGMTRREIDIILDNAKFGGLDFLYVSPERLKTDLFIARFMQMKVSLIAIDEAHCVSEWGHDFRPPYKEIHELREVHKDVPMIALTATATERVQDDVIEQLKMRNPNRFEGDFHRSNISYELYKIENKRAAILKACKRFEGASGIVYCQTRRSTKEVARFLLANNYAAGIYNGGMDNKARNTQLEKWMRNETRIMVATNAFGMGIDKPDVRFVLHYEIPNNLEAYFQEAGRAGRDGKESRNLAFYETADIKLMQKRLEDQFPPIDFVKTVYRALCNHLGVAIGSGHNESYNLSLSSFIQKYDFPPVPTYSALKILGLNNTLILNESVFQPTRLKFAVTNKTLYNFQIKYAKYDALTMLLSRSYPGIFSNFFAVDTFKISKRLKISEKAVNEQLAFLEKQGIIDIVWQSDSPQVIFQHERLPDDYLRIDKSVYNHRKKVAFDKFDGMLSFINSISCRSVNILNYFGQKGTRCGKCDICLMEQKSDYTMEELSEGIQSFLKNEPMTYNDLKQGLNLKQEEQLRNALDWLVDEGKISFKSDKFQLD